MSFKAKKICGFTLIEILSTVIIIGVLASLAIPSYLWVVERSRSAEAKEILCNMFACFHRLKIDDEWFDATHPINWSRCGMSDPNTLSTRYFNYTFLPDENTPETGRAQRINDPNKWLEINLSSGDLTKSVHY